jgi:hypothetical protein
MKSKKEVIQEIEDNQLDILEAIQEACEANDIKEQERLRDLSDRNIWKLGKLYKY